MPKTKIFSTTDAFYTSKKILKFYIYELIWSKNKKSCQKRHLIKWSIIQKKNFQEQAVSSYVNGIQHSSQCHN